MFKLLRSARTVRRGRDPAGPRVGRYLHFLKRTEPVRSSIPRPYALTACFLIAFVFADRQSLMGRESVPPGDCDHLGQWQAQASEAISLGQLDEAARLLERVTTCRPDSGEAWWRLGTVAYDRGEYEHALQAFRRLTELWPGYGPAYLFTGLALFQQGDYEGAFAEIRRANRLGVGDAKIAKLGAYYEVLSLVVLSRFEQADSFLPWIINAEPENPKTHELVGMTVLRIASLPEDLDADRREMARRIGRAVSLGQMGALEEARLEFEGFFQKFRDVPHAHYVFGVLLLQLDRDEAVKEFEAELERDPAHLPSLLRLALEYKRRNQLESAQHYAEKSLTVAPDSPAATSILGQIKLEQGDVETGIHFLERAVRLAPEHPKLHLLLAQAYARARRVEEANREREIYERLSEEARARGEAPEAAVEP